MKYRFVRSGVCKTQPTVPQLRGLLEQVLETAVDDESLSEVALHISRAIDALDSARAMALAVMREIEAESTEPCKVARRKLC